jgi:hypothetical protein
VCLGAVRVYEEEGERVGVSCAWWVHRADRGQSEPQNMKTGKRQSESCLACCALKHVPVGGWQVCMRARVRHIKRKPPFLCVCRALCYRAPEAVTVKMPLLLPLLRRRHLSTFLPPHHPFAFHPSPNTMGFEEQQGLHNEKKRKATIKPSLF